MSANLGTTAKIHADFEAPDRIVFGLTARQIAIISVAGALAWLIFNSSVPGCRCRSPASCWYPWSASPPPWPSADVTGSLSTPGCGLPWPTGRTPRHAAPVGDSPASVRTRLPTWAPDVRPTDERDRLPTPYPCGCPPTPSRTTG